MHTKPLYYVKSVIMVDVNEIELKKHSALIQMKNSITATQRKMFNSLLYLSAQILYTQPDTQVFKLKISEIRRLSGLTEFTNRKYLKEQLKELQEISVEYNLLGKDKATKWLQFSLLSQVGLENGSEYAEVAFPPAIHSNLKNPEIYSLLNLGLMNNLSGKYSVALYELLQDYKKIHRLRIDIIAFKNLLNVSLDKYKNFNVFREKVIDYSVNEINEKTDLKIEYELERSGRTYSSIIFNIQSSQNILETATQALLRTYKISKHNIDKFCNALPNEVIINCIDTLEKSNRVRNRVAYLTRLLENAFQDYLQGKLDLQLSAKLHPIEVEKPIIVQNPKDNIDFKKYYKNKTNNILKQIQPGDVEEFLSLQSDFTKNYLLEKGVLNSEWQVIGVDILLEMGIFVGWVQNKYLDTDIEFHNFKTNENKDY